MVKVRSSRVELELQYRRSVANVALQSGALRGGIQAEQQHWKRRSLSIFLLLLHSNFQSICNAVCASFPARFSGP